MFDWIKEKLFGGLLAKYSGAIVRGLLQFVAGGLVYAHIPQEAIDKFQVAAEPVVQGLLMFAGTLIWSLVQKSKSLPSGLPPAKTK